MASTSLPERSSQLTPPPAVASPFLAATQPLETQCFDSKLPRQRPSLCQPQYTYKHHPQKLAPRCLQRAGYHTLPGRRNKWASRWNRRTQVFDPGEVHWMTTGPGTGGGEDRCCETQRQRRLQSRRAEAGVASGHFQRPPAKAEEYTAKNTIVPGSAEDEARNAGESAMGRFKAAMNEKPSLLFNLYGSAH